MSAVAYSRRHLRIQLVINSGGVLFLLIVVPILIGIAATEQTVESWFVAGVMSVALLYNAVWVIYAGRELHRAVPPIEEPSWVDAADLLDGDKRPNR